MVLTKESPGLVSLQLRCPLLPTRARAEEGAAVQPVSPFPPPVYTFAAPLQRSGGPRSGLLLGRGVHSHPTLESKGRRLGGDPPAL